MKRILVVEDEVEFARLIKLHLEDAGFSVTLAHDGHDAVQFEQSNAFDLVILDLMLPGMDGLEVCRRIRKLTNYTPILMLTARSSEIDRVLGLEVGADDYLVKPCSLRELVARVKAVFRRVAALGRSRRTRGSLRFGPLEIESAKRAVKLDGEAISLTAKEFELLLQFALSPGRVYSRSELLDLVWGYGEGVYEHTVNSHINRLRGKIEEDPASPRFVLTVWGVGYRFFDPDQDEPLATLSLVSPADEVAPPVFTLVQG